jgi:hypothetical protein
MRTNHATERPISVFILSMVRLIARSTFIRVFVRKAPFPGYFGRAVVTVPKRFALVNSRRGPSQPLSRCQPAENPELAIRGWNCRSGCSVSFAGLANSQTTQESDYADPARGKAFHVVRFNQQ